MKQLISILLIAILFTGCKKKEAQPADASSSSSSSSNSSAVLKYSGTFVKGPYGNVSGKAEIYQNPDNSYELRVNGFNTNDGPKLRMVISEYLLPGQYTEIGKLKGLSGNHTYAISGSPDFSKYKYVSVHCVAYDHLFGYAILQ